MKRILFISIAVFSTFQMNAQGTTAGKSGSYETAMQQQIHVLDTTKTIATILTLANQFERIAVAEKTRWLPFYYAAHCYAVTAVLSSKTEIDAYADKAEALLQQAEAMEASSSEIPVLAAMIHSSRIMVDPPARFQSTGPQVHALLAKAKAQDPANPRIYLLEARMLARTPEAFGGGKAAAAFEAMA